MLSVATIKARPDSLSSRFGQIGNALLLAENRDWCSNRRNGYRRQMEVQSEGSALVNLSVETDCKSDLRFVFLSIKCQRRWQDRNISEHLFLLRASSPSLLSDPGVRRALRLSTTDFPMFDIVCKHHLLHLMRNPVCQRLVCSDDFFFC